MMHEYHPTISQMETSDFTYPTGFASPIPSKKVKTSEEIFPISFHNYTGQPIFDVYYELPTNARFFIQ